MTRLHNSVIVNTPMPLTLVSVVLFFRLYMALRAYIAEREYRRMPRAKTGFRLPCFFLADFLSPSAIWNEAQQQNHFKLQVVVTNMFYTREL